MSKRKRTAVATSTPSTNITWPAVDLAELFGWADNQLSAVVQWPDISDVVQPPKWDETGAISNMGELP